MAGTPRNEKLQRYIEDSVGAGALADRVATVMLGLPEAVVTGFLEDSLFRLSVDDLVEGRGRTVWMACPEPGGNGSRCVVLKPRLAEGPLDFAQYIIAHELAHAHLRNGGWGKIEDPEQAADALAAAWGFGRPDSIKWNISPR